MMSLQSQEISRCLKKASESTFEPIKFAYYCKAAKLQCQSEYYSNASDTYLLASHALKQITYDAGRVSRLLKLSEISTLLNPNYVPKELVAAERELKNNCERAIHHPFLRGECTVDLAKLADRYFQLKAPEKGEHYLSLAKKWQSHCKLRDEERKSFKFAISEATVYKIGNGSGKPVDVVRLLEHQSYQDPVCKCYTYLLAAESNLPIFKVCDHYLKQKAWDIWKDIKECDCHMNDDKRVWMTQMMKKIALQRS